MREARVVVTTLATLLLARSVVAQDAARTSKYFTFEVERGRGSAEHVALVTSQAIAAADAAAAALEKALQTKFVVKPMLVLHWEASTFRAVEKQQSKLRFVVEEFCLPDATAAHVLRSPAFEDEVGKRVGLPEPARLGLMRCAVRLLAMQVSESARADRWLTDIVAHGVLESLTNPTGAPGIDPYFDLRRIYHARNVRSKFVFELRDALLSTEEPRDRESYDVQVDGAAVFAQFFAKESSGYVRKLLSRPAKAMGVVPNRMRVFEAIVGKDHDRAQARWQAMLATLDPAWFPNGHARPTEGGFELASGRDRQAALLREAAVPPRGYTMRGRVTIADFGTKAVRIGFDFEGMKHIAVILAPGTCEVSEWIENGGWQKPIVKGASPQLVDRPFDLEVDSRDAKLRILVDGVEVASIPADARTLKGVVRIACNEAIVRLENLRIEPLQPAKK